MTVGQERRGKNHMASVTWRVKGEEANGCNCAWGCPCQFNALPTHGNCEGVMTARITDGYFGTVRLDGVRFAAAFSFPRAIHEGNGTFQLVAGSCAVRAGQPFRAASQAGAR